MATRRKDLEAGIAPCSSSLWMVSNSLIHIVFDISGMLHVCLLGRHPNPDRAARCRNAAAVGGLIACFEGLAKRTKQDRETHRTRDLPPPRRDKG